MQYVCECYGWLPYGFNGFHMFLVQANRLNPTKWKENLLFIAKVDPLLDVCNVCNTVLLSMVECDT